MIYKYLMISWIGATKKQTRTKQVHACDSIEAVVRSCHLLEGGTSSPPAVHIGVDFKQSAGPGPWFTGHRQSPLPPWSPDEHITLPLWTARSSLSLRWRMMNIDIIDLNSKSKSSGFLAVLGIWPLESSTDQHRWHISDRFFHCNVHHHHHSYCSAVQISCLTLRVADKDPSDFISGIQQETSHEVWVSGCDSFQRIPEPFVWKPDTLCVWCKLYSTHEVPRMPLIQFYTKKSRAAESSNCLCPPKLARKRCLEWPVGTHQ